MPKLFFLFFLIYLLIGGKLPSNVVLVSTVQISHNYIYITFLLRLPPFPSLHPSKSSQSTRMGSLCYLTTSHQLSILYMVVYISQWCFLHSSLSLFPLQWPQVHSRHLRLHSFPANRFVKAIFLDSIYIYIFHISVLIYNICFSLYDLLHSV